MGRISRRTWLLSTGALACVPLWGAVGCGPTVNTGATEDRTPRVRVKLIGDTSDIQLGASGEPLVKAGSDASPRRVQLGSGVRVTLSNGRWQVGSVGFGSGELSLTPGTGPISLNGVSYRGSFRLVPSGSGSTFDVINDVDLDGYLKSVVSKELYRLWDDETYMAQTIVARTYALYELKTTGQGRGWDVYADTRSQVYGGLDAETSKSRSAVENTSGVVAAYGVTGREKIFKAYFSSCCGGVTQSAADAFNDAWSQPLSDRNNGSLCNASPRFNWGPVSVDKTELTRRIKLWGQRKDRAVQNMSDVARIDVQAVNRFGRPVRFMVTDARGTRYSLGGEELRWAVNTDAPDRDTTLFSSFCRIINDDATRTIRFVDGHGHGHGVGMCQWCAQAMAENGVRHEDIVIRSFSGARLARAY